VATTTLLTVLQYRRPEIRLALWRDPEQLRAGQWWRLLSALFVQYDAAWMIVVVLVLITAVGVLAERLFGHLYWLLIYFGCGVVGQAFGWLWLPHTSDAGASVAGAGLLGAVCTWLLSPAAPRLARLWVWAIVWLVVGVVLTAVRDIHGPPLSASAWEHCWFGAISVGLGALLVWRDQRRQAPDSEYSSDSRSWRRARR
jgi:membrane associated rhomboid family serine protease